MIINFDKHQSSKIEKKLFGKVPTGSVIDVATQNLKGGFTKKYLALDSDGKDVYPSHPSARYFDLNGAVYNACYKVYAPGMMYNSKKASEEYGKIITILEKMIGVCLTKINDHPSCDAKFWIEKLMEIKNEVD